MNRIDEVQRIRDVYAGYEREEATHQRWSTVNPGNAAILVERSRAVDRVLHTLPSRHERLILDVGCGSGSSLYGLEASIGDSRVIGLDLQLPRVRHARGTHPQFGYFVGDASILPVPAASVDVILCFTVFSSILDPQVASSIAGELRRVLAPHGSILLYDMRVNSPGNPNVHAVDKNAVAALFHGMAVRCKSMTVLPPLARRLGRSIKYLYPMLTQLPFFHTHHLCVIQHS